jgi:DNA topoisomerase-1
LKVPELDEGTDIPVKTIDVIEKQTSPPPRYTSASLVKKMEDEGIGTKATRAEIVRLLWERGYIRYEKNSGLVPTKLGEKLIEISEKFCPLITDVALTADLENKLESIMDNRISHNDVIAYARINVEKILEQIIPNLSNIGKELIANL